MFLVMGATGKVGGATAEHLLAPPRVVALSSMGANRTSGLGMITALSLLEQGFRDLISPIAFVRAGGFFENFLYDLQVAQGGTLPVYYNPTNRRSTMVATNDIGAEVATLLTEPAWSGRRVVELGSMVTAEPHRTCRRHV